MKNPSLLSAFSGLCIMACAGHDALGAATPQMPNIVLIVADDLGYGELGVQGYSRDIPTPNIDSIARNGVRFTQAYVAAPMCSPSRAGLLTGVYPQRFGHEFNPNPDAPGSVFGLPAERATLAERLKRKGYATGIVGKWHLGTRSEFIPQRRGFDEFFGTLAGMRPYFSRSTHDPLLRGSSPVDEPDYLTEALAREAAQFIQRHHQKPFFLYLPFTAVHTPLQAPEKYLARFRSIGNEKRRTFAAMVSAMDDAVGRVLRQLADSKLADKTLLFFISDNGGSTPATTSGNGPLRGHKGQLFEGGIRVPFLAQWPGHLPSGEVNDKPVISLDIYPTALAASGAAIDSEGNLDGVNLLPYVRGEERSRPHQTLYWRRGRQHAVRDGDWKLLVLPRLGSPALFNLASDSGEHNDLAGTNPGKVKDLTALYDAWNAQMISPRWADKNAPGHRKTQRGTEDAHNDSQDSED